MCALDVTERESETGLELESSSAPSTSLGVRIGRGESILPSENPLHHRLAWTRKRVLAVRTVSLSSVTSKKYNNVAIVEDEIIIIIVIVDTNIINTLMAALLKWTVTLSTMIVEVIGNNNKCSLDIAWSDTRTKIS